MWGRECEYLAEAGVDIATGLDMASKVMLDLMCRIENETLSIIKPLQ